MGLTHLLDSSAWLAHIFDEPGADAITALLEAEDTELGISVLSVVEVHGRFRARGRAAEFDEVLEIYRQLFTRILPVSEAIAMRAVALRQEATARVPAIDSLIAATAAHHGAILVHRDGHFAALPAEVRQQALADA